MAKEQEMGVILMRPLTSGVFQRLMAQAFPQLGTLDVGRLLLNYVLSDPYVDVALVGMREPRFVQGARYGHPRDLGRRRVPD